MSLCREGIYKLDGFFIKGKDVMAGREIVNQYDYQKMFDGYCDLFEHEEFDKIKIKFNDQMYEKQFNLPNGDYYKVIWSIELLKKAIKHFGIKPQKALLSQVVEIYEADSINPNRLEYAKNNDEPIIVAIFPCTNPQYFILDGNHRVASKWEQGQKTIDAYLLVPHQFLMGITSKYLQKLVMAHYNMWLADQYMIGKCGEADFKYSFFQI